MYSWYNLKRLYKEAKGGAVKGAGSEGVVVSDPRLLFEDEVLDVNDKHGSKPWSEVSKVFFDNIVYEQTLRRLDSVVDALGDSEACNKYFVMPTRRGPVMTNIYNKYRKVYNDKWGQRSVPSYSAANNYTINHISYPKGSPLAVKDVTNVEFSYLLNLVDGLSFISSRNMVFTDAKVENVVQINNTYKFIDYASTFPLSLCTSYDPSRPHTEEEMYFIQFLKPGYVPTDTTYQIAIRGLLSDNTYLDSDYFDMTRNGLGPYFVDVYTNWRDEYLDVPTHRIRKQSTFSGLLVNVSSRTVVESVKTITATEEEFTEMIVRDKELSSEGVNYTQRIWALQLLLKKNEYHGRLACAINIYAMGMILWTLSARMQQPMAFYNCIVSACTTFLPTGNNYEIFVVCPSMSEFRKLVQEAVDL